MLKQTVLWRKRHKACAMNRGGYNRRVSNGDRVKRIAHLALKRGKSVDFTGYWQRHLES